MYFNNTNNFFHGIMFHHFHDEKLHVKSQGSISSDDLSSLVKFIGRKNIIDAEVFYEKYYNKKLNNREVCFTFDDAIKCQIDVALPVLEDLKIKSFFFIYTSIFDGKPDNLEVYRYFRTICFEKIDDFYFYFYKVLGKDLKFFFDENEKFIINRKKICPYYSIEDIKFRLVRDKFLSKNNYEKIMNIIMKEKKFSPSKYYKTLFFDKKDLKRLSSLGHSIGLHSHSHPTLLESLPNNLQKIEYEKCIGILADILETSRSEIKFMSHPCGSYNNDTLEILKELGIKMGFKQIMNLEQDRGMKNINNSFLEIARQDHADIMKRM
ncbi:MAG: hypothetical protein CFH34_00961 [Alphaproteobacteria bacterium MarineAlpha9_Bin4]|nr:hypothetical protein [Pelagibacterales bacterium]PPR26433.1 MAG: hypothetical protein CFH34_00961 [Alphaproteobacteria bacterium MarineAlpha9_Bin4]|tara:strand:+ start:29 stop:994 length:966 start_codon:yes stop_codon:yes gene_type:complete